MKKYLVIILILSLFAPISGTYTWLKIESQIIKKSVKRKIINGVDKSELTRLTFTNSEFNTQVRWEHEKEFEFKGEMYDVVYTQLENGETVYYCWWDKAETELNRTVNKLTKLALNSNKNHDSQKDEVNNFINGLYFSENKTQSDKKLLHEIKHHFIYEFSIKSLYHKTTSPPPKHC